MFNEDIFNLKGRTAIVTGGAGYLGSALSEGLAKQGANVAIVSKNLKKCTDLANLLNKKYNSNCQGYFVDIESSSSICETFRKTQEEFGSIDILVNNAYFGNNRIIQEQTDKEWEYGINGTINSVYRCTKYALKYMLPQHKGNIINIASMYGIVSPDPTIYEDPKYSNPANYGAGKAAIIQFTKYIACHYGTKGIRANAISPGPFPNKKVQQNTNFIKNLEKKTPLGRIGKPSELQGTVVYLASHASDYVTGQNICVDGGWTAW